ncbi:PAS domain-containing protein [Thalassobacter stenotrophicus]|uniref:Nif-specific regulatory protein n=2 Tax=Thalassobacter stenotrophicus TaxID=266809 RepID=A0A0P1EZE0_9RHOB|nr:PAS domain-containing protein [Thalassobacter stenotrophicus]CUH60611.1 Formate hydrogenlyase transcriptional activator [Thalassobacter stenotrophicus]SHJ37364.1 DNA-binding protein Fis [Thalassobacter stenotrophicus DSM 16310]
MLDTETPHDSFLAGAFGPTILLHLGQDLILAATEETKTLLGDDALIGSHFARFVAAGMETFVVFITEVQHRGTAWTREVTFQKSDQTPLQCEVTGRAIHHDGQDMLLLHVLDLETLEQHAAEARARKIYNDGLIEWQRAQSFFADLERENQLILNAAGEGIYGVNADGKTTFVNRAAQEMLGWTTQDLLGHDIHAKIHHHHLNGEQYPSHECPIYQSFRYEQVNRIENEVFWRKDGKPIRVEYVSTPIYDGPRLVGAVVIFRDITERWENERKLRDAMDQVAALRDQLEEENAYLQEAINIERAHHDIIGRSAAIQAILKQIELVGPTDTSVLIRGESGVGKSLVASAVHDESTRKRRPMIHFKAGAVSPEKIESELFGQVRGAFAGALKDRPGKLELAHGGTLFIDEVADIPIELQGHLLDALQNREVIRLGDDRTRSLDLRVIASTNRDIDREVQAGRLRPDLMLHLGVFPILCPPLRDRQEDIPILTAHLLRIVCKRLGRKVPVVTEGAMRKLQDYHWPGNVRELANVIERGAIVSQSDKLEVEIQSQILPGALLTSALLTEADVEQIRRTNIIACMKEASGKVSGNKGAAALLGIKPTTLYSRLKKLGLSESDW